MMHKCMMVKIGGSKKRKLSKKVRILNEKLLFHSHGLQKHMYEFCRLRCSYILGSRLQFQEKCIDFPTI